MFLPMSWTSPLTVASSILPRADVAGLRLLRLHERQQIGDRLLHHARALDDLREEHLARAEEVADDVHAVHQRPFDDRRARSDTSPRLLEVGVEVLDDALDERVREALLDACRCATPPPLSRSAASPGL